MTLTWDLPEEVWTWGCRSGEVPSGAAARARQDQEEVEPSWVVITSAGLGLASSIWIPQGVLENEFICLCLRRRGRVLCSPACKSSLELWVGGDNANFWALPIFYPVEESGL